MVAQFVCTWEQDYRLSERVLTIQWIQWNTIMWKERTCFYSDVLDIVIFAGIIIKYISIRNVYLQERRVYMMSNWTEQLVNSTQYNYMKNELR